jgi:hypothetical protein
MYFRPLLFFGGMGSAVGLTGWMLWNGDLARVLPAIGGLFWVLGFYLDWQLNVMRLHHRGTEIPYDHRRESVEDRRAS